MNPFPTSAPDSRAGGRAGGRETPRDDLVQNFLLGSSATYHQPAHQMPEAGPSSRVYATGGSQASSSYATAHSGWTPPPQFASHISYPDAPQYTRAYKSAASATTSSAALPNPYAAYLYSTSPAYASASHMAISAANNARFVEPQRPSRTQAAAQAVEENRRTDTPEDCEHEDEDEGEYAPAKKHACMMCHKSFDRPSTVKKHLLVHTGEKAHECPDCHRRFSVVSNLRRHMRLTCAARTGNSRAGSRSTPEQATSTPEQASTSAPQAATPVAGTDTAGPPASASASTSEAQPSTSRSSSRKRRASPSDAPETAPARPKRRRRAPSPSQWIPDSLRVFDLTPYAKSTPVPLPPVEPCPNDERDSFDARVSASPYHPDGWQGRLPGPALLEPQSMGHMGARMLVI